jgi:hypothetical protein
VQDTVMAIYTSPGGCGGPFTELACNDDEGDLKSAISRTLNAGTTYYIVVWMASTSPVFAGTQVQLRVSQPTVPVNDTCAGAELIPSSGPFPYLTATTDNTLAGTAGDPPIPICQSNAERSVWYQFTPDTSALYGFSLDTNTATSTYDTLLGVYTSASACGGPFTLVACNDNAATNTHRSALTTSLAAGVSYYIVVWEAGTDPYTPGETSVQLRVSRQLLPQVTTLPPASITSTGAVLQATVNPCGLATAAWFEWGTTTNYGYSTLQQPLGSNATTLALTTPITTAGLQTWHFRARATNAAGVALGLDRALGWNSTRPVLAPVSPVATGAWHLLFNAASNQCYLVQTSTNLTSWSVLGLAVDSGTGVFQFDDTNSPGPRRFYRLLAP